MRALNKNVKVILGESAIASLAATLCAIVLELPIWIMFIGWIAFFTRGLTLKSGVLNWVSIIAGMLIGAGASMALPFLSGPLSVYAISVAVFGVTILCLGLTSALPASNLLCIFLGVVTFFASHHAVAALDATLALLIGSAAALAAHQLQIRINASSEVANI